MRRIDLLVDRFYSTDKFTLGVLKYYYYTGGNQSLVQKFWCYTLEDPYQAQKIAGITRIPAGKYEITLRPDGGKYQKYFKKFGEWQKPGMLWIKDVPQFEWILIHPGNSIEDTEGCLIVGRSQDEKNGLIGYSNEAYEALYKRLVEPLQTGTKVYIEYQDNDR